jgi:phosphoribosyl 1,2-cyclic phosphate phosphodiesterase
VPDGESFSVGGTQITPIALADDHVYAFLFQDEGRRLFVAADELVGWEPPSSLGHLDLAVIPIGIVEIDPLTGERYTPANHPVLESEATFEQTLAIVRQMDADRVMMTHIEEPDQMGFDKLQILEAKLAAEGLDISFAYDGLVVDV